MHHTSSRHLSLKHGAAIAGTCWITDLLYDIACRVLDVGLSFAEMPYFITGASWVQAILKDIFLWNNKTIRPHVVCLENLLTCGFARSEGNLQDLELKKKSKQLNNNSSQFQLRVCWTKHTLFDSGYRQNPQITSGLFAKKTVIMESLQMALVTKGWRMDGWCQINLIVFSTCAVP